MGYTLHTLYTTMENYFLRILKTFENHLPSDSWHRHLIEAMQLDLPGIRPAFMGTELAGIADELRGFRHVFRSVYESRIDPDRITLLQNKIPRMRELFSAAGCTVMLYRNLPLHNSLPNTNHADIPDVAS